jgi:HEAT repeat protein
MKQTLLIGLALVVLVGCGKKKEKEYTAASLLQLLRDKDPKMRYYAARQLGHFGSQAGEVVPALTEALKDEDKNVRMVSAYSLGEIGPGARSALPALQTALRDPEAEVRQAADYAIKKMSNQGSQGKDQGQRPKRKHKRKFPRQKG